MNTDPIEVVAFDADDTLWYNERYFRKAEDQFAELVKDYLPRDQAINALFSKEMKLLPIYGYGIKAFVLSMVETAIEISKGAVSTDKIRQILAIGRVMANEPVELMDEVQKVLVALREKYRLILATKGDLIDQERKLVKSGLSEYFHHVEVMSEKKEANYKRLIRHLDIRPAKFLMIGNSMKSDIVPVLNIGGNAIHIPHEITWQHEMVSNEEIKKYNFLTVAKLTDILPYLNK